MKRRTLAGVLLITIMPLATAAAAEDCFPACAQSLPNIINDEIKSDNSIKTTDADPRSAAVSAPCRDRREGSILHRADNFNDQIKPVREIAGYVRSPQGLAFKLVNDHIVQIPAWIGYAVDPVGSIRARTIDSAKTRLREAWDAGARCDAVADDSLPGPAEVIDAKYSF